MKANAPRSLRPEDGRTPLRLRVCVTTKPERGLRGFTLIEIMIVVAIMAIVMGMTVPFAWKALRREGMTKAVNEVLEVCQNARAMAIIQGRPTYVVFHPEDGKFEVDGAAPAAPNPDGSAGTSAASANAILGPNAGLSGHFPANVAVASLRINGVSMMDSTIARVRFNPNGTSDELRMVLLSETRESRGIFTEITTGLATVESDAQKLSEEIGP